MLRFCALSLLAIATFAADLQIDHVTVAGSNLDAMRQAFLAAVGIAPEYGGQHTNGATEMALVSFPDGSYLELMAIRAHADAQAVDHHEWSSFLTRNAGPCAFALRAPDLSAATAQLKQRGVAVSVIARNGRARPDGTRLEWQIANIGAGARGTFFPFLIHDLTPRENRADPSGRPTTDRYAGIAKVVLGVDDLDTAVHQYRRAFALPAPKRQRDRDFQADLAWFEGTPILLAHGLPGSWLEQRTREFGNLPCAFILGANSGLTGARASVWFNRPILWTDDSRLGWRLGIEPVSGR